jgi:hypothetical protein
MRRNATMLRIAAPPQRNSQNSVRQSSSCALKVDRARTWLQECLPHHPRGDGSNSVVQ